MQAVQLENISLIDVGGRPLAEKAAASGMSMPLKRGVILIRAGVVVPGPSELKGSAVRDWNCLALPAPEFEEWLRGTGWQWSYYVPSLTHSRWGLTQRKAIDRAVRAGLTGAEKKGLNSVEIESIVVHGVPGLYRATVNSGLRNLQQGPFLRELNPHHRVAHSGHRRGLAAVANRKGVHMKAM